MVIFAGVVSFVRNTSVYKLNTPEKKRYGRKYKSYFTPDQSG